MFTRHRGKKSGYPQPPTHRSLQTEAATLQPLSISKAEVNVCSLFDRHYLTEPKHLDAPTVSATLSGIINTIYYRCSPIESLKEDHVPFRILIVGLFFVTLVPAPTRAQQPSSRSWTFNLNWQEFRQLVPACRVKTDHAILSGAFKSSRFYQQRRRQHGPVGLAHSIAADVNALIAPHIPYGITDILAPYPGSLRIPEEPFRLYVRAVLVGLVNNGFKNIIILNGHGPQIPILQQLAQDIALEYKVNTLVVNWWILGTDIRIKCSAKTVAMQRTTKPPWSKPSIRNKFTGSSSPQGSDMAGGLSAGSCGRVVGGSISSHHAAIHARPGNSQRSTQAKADEYYAKVVAKVKALVLDTLHRWEVAGFN